MQYISWPEHHTKGGFPCLLPSMEKPWRSVCVCVCVRACACKRERDHIGKHCTSSTEVVWLNSRKVFTPTYTDFSLFCC